MALVRFADAEGKTLAFDISQMPGVKELATVVVRGKASRDSQGNLTVVAGEVLFAPSQADVQKNTLAVKVLLANPPATLKPDRARMKAWVCGRSKGESGASAAERRSVSSPCLNNPLTPDPLPRSGGEGRSVSSPVPEGEIRG